VRSAHLLTLLLVACKEDPPTPPDCSGPDFDVVITALDAPLPADTLVSVEYGGGEMEEYSPTEQPECHVLFCSPSDREGNPVGHGGQCSSGFDGLGGAGGETSGGAGGKASGGLLEGLRCKLWTDGPATVTVRTSMYPIKPVPLSAKTGKCTVSAEIELGPDDGGA
jgi:hypothetical protein